MVSNAFVQLLGKEHPDIAYLKNDKIATVLSKALAETFRAKPNDPKTYFAKYLLNHSAQEKAAGRVSETVCLNFQRLEREKEVQVARRQLLAKKIDEEKKVKAELKKTQEADENKAQFWQKVEKSNDLHDNLEELTNYLKNNTNATGVYIGKLVYPLKRIEEDAGENDHEDTEAPKVIRYLYATDDHKFMLNRVLPPDRGVTHDVFKDSPAAEEPEQQQDENAEDGGEPKPVQEQDILKTFKHVYVPEVVRQKNPEMLYHKVPRLGCYMAVPLVYNSCLFDDSLEQAVADLIDVTQRREAQSKEQTEYYEGFNSRKEAAVNNNEPFEEEERQWEVIETKPFASVESQWVVMLDTLGQDRQFTDDQKRFILQTVQHFGHIWEAQEEKVLTNDRDHKLEMINSDKTAQAEID